MWVGTIRPATAVEVVVLAPLWLVFAEDPPTLLLAFPEVLRIRRKQRPHRCPVTFRRSTLIPHEDHPAPILYRQPQMLRIPR